MSILSRLLEKLGFKKPAPTTLKASEAVPVDKAPARSVGNVVKAPGPLRQPLSQISRGASAPDHRSSGPALINEDSMATDMLINQAWYASGNTAASEPEPVHSPAPAPVVECSSYRDTTPAPSPIYGGYGGGGCYGDSSPSPAPAPSDSYSSSSTDW